MAKIVTEEVEDFLNELDGWEQAYPLSVFPEPDLARAADLLKAGGMTLDAISASNMRHVVSKIAPKARAAIEAMRASSAGGNLSDLEGRLRDDAMLCKERSVSCRKIGDAHGASLASQIADDLDEAAWTLHAQQPPSNEARLREALKNAPIIGRLEPAEAFRARQDVWLNGEYRAALATPQQEKK